MRVPDSDIEIEVMLPVVLGRVRALCVLSNRADG
ncbi:MAG: hypothetical protein JWL65_5249 [Gammaproteobacteria bacterium]|nr:hypothetical protein [Gammaproteobacteria bacterium]